MGQLSPASGPVAAVHAVDGFKFLQPARVHDPLRAVTFQSLAVEWMALKYLIVR
jgi:hypothetical protein